MVDLTRRKTVIGLGLLATGSGATFTSAAFSNEVEASSDFRVVAEQGLVVEPDDDVDTVSKIADNESNPSAFLFNSSTEINQNNVNLGDIKGGGQAAINDQTDGNLELAIAVADDGSPDEFNILQVRNNGDTTENVGVSIPDQLNSNSSVDGYGSDVNGPQSSGNDIASSDVDSAFTFEIEDSPGSTTYKTVSDTTGQDVDPGDTHGVRITIDVDVIPDADLQSAVSGSGNPFGGNSVADTVDLVDTIEVGVDPS